MTTSNPYKAPASDVSQTRSNRTYQPKIFATNGRIGRLRYLAYSMVGYLAFIPVVIIAGIAGAMSEGGEASGPGLIVGLLMVITYIAFIVYYFILAKRRFNDMDHSGWMSLLMIIPLVNMFVGLWLIFGRGNLGVNKFGAAPCENSLSVKIFGLFVPIFMIVGVGILAAVALPAYQDYVERANQAQIELQNE